MAGNGAQLYPSWAGGAPGSFIEQIAITLGVVSDII